MARFGYLAVWADDGPVAARWPASADGELDRLAGARRNAGPALTLVLFGDATGRVRTTSAGDWVLGSLFDAPPSYVAAPSQLDLEAPAPLDRARRLLARYWGGYVALLRDTHGFAALRDPSGALEAILWRTRGLRCAASSLDVVPPSLAPACAVDWEELGAQVADRLRSSGAAPLTGVQTAAPGALVGAGSGTVALWTPAEIVRVRSQPASSERLREAASGCVAAWGSVLRRPLVEVSGGLDSAIVTASLGVRTRARAARFVNHVVEEEGADERGYARAVAELWTIPLTEALKGEAVLDPAALALTADALRPAFNAADVDYDRAVIALAVEAGADAVVTGQGGDAVFLTLRSPAMAVDLLRGRPLSAWADGELLALARWTHRSVWSLALRALTGSGRVRPTGRFSRFASARARALARYARPHPWLQGTEGLAPGRRLQIEGLVDALIFQGDSLRARGVTLVHPLLSQPLLEAVLAMPVEALVRGGRDRSLAREAFASVLPPQIVRRRSKGDMTAFYGRMIARSLTVLRPFLLDGELAQAGFVDRDGLETGLTRERLAADGGYGELMDLAVQEAWTRRWAGAARAR